MKVAILKRDYGQSFRVYQSNVVDHMCRYPVEVSYFTGDCRGIPDDTDLVWIQGAPIVDTYRVLRHVDCPIVTTIHGVDQFTLPLRRVTPGHWERFRWTVKKPIQYFFWRIIRHRISAVVTVSDYCKRRVQDVYGFKEQKVHRIYHGYDRSVFSEKGEAYKHRRRYLLHVSSGKAKKNVSSIVEAYCRLDGIDVDLLLVAPEYVGPVPDDQGVVSVGNSNYVSQQELAKLYRGAVGFVFPSYDETFGLPLLEAMGCGCPVITSDRSACPEVVGDSGLFVDPLSEREISENMDRITHDESLRSQLVARLREQRKRFSWQKSAKQHYEVFKSAIGA